MKLFLMLMIFFSQFAFAESPADSTSKIRRALMNALQRVEISSCTSSEGVVIESHYSTFLEDINNRDSQVTVVSSSEGTSIQVEIRRKVASIELTRTVQYHLSADRKSVVSFSARISQGNLQNVNSGTIDHPDFEGEIVYIPRYTDEGSCQFQQI